MFEVSSMKCIECNVFYEPNNFFEKDIKNMRENNKLLYCKNCVNTIKNEKKIINYYFVNIGKNQYSLKE